MTLAELTKKGPAELGVGGRTRNNPFLGGLLFCLLSPLALKPTMDARYIKTAVYLKNNKTYRAERASPKGAYRGDPENSASPSPETVCIQFHIIICSPCPCLFLNTHVHPRTQMPNRGCSKGADSHLWPIPRVSQEGLGLPHHGGHEGQGAMRSLFRAQGRLGTEGARAELPPAAPWLLIPSLPTAFSGREKACICHHLAKG